LYDLIDKNIIIGFTVFRGNVEFDLKSVDDFGVNALVQVRVFFNPILKHKLKAGTNSDCRFHKILAIFIEKILKTKAYKQHIKH